MVQQDIYPASLAHQAEVVGGRKVWGKNSLSLGEVIFFILAAVVIWKQIGGKYALPLAMALMFLGMAFF